jgi:NAD(P)-dependent dehydrogenase (short-subunit alcohol dehydrogenase family)
MTATTLPFADRTALVTGAARGIGAAVARTLAIKGADVVVADVLEAEGHETAARLRAEGLRVRFVHLDVTDPLSWDAAVFETIEQTGGLDIVVNNAGIEVTSLIVDADPLTFRRLCDVNLTGVLLGMKSAFQAMRPGGAAGRGGAVVNIASTAAQSAFPTTGLYAATKSGVERLTKVGAVEAGKLGYGVRVNCVYPGFVTTALSAESARKVVAMGLFPDVESLQAFLLDQTPLGRLGTAQDVAETVAFLCSDAAGFVTGAGVPVSGGMGLH